MIYINHFFATLNHPLAIILLVVIGVAFIHQIYFYLRYLRLGGKVTPKTDSNIQLPAVSVIVCAHNEYDNLHLSVIDSHDVQL